MEQKGGMEMRRRLRDLFFTYNRTNKEEMDGNKPFTWKRMIKNNFLAVRIFIYCSVFFLFCSLGVVPSESMNPTLEVKDGIIYAKFTEVEAGDIVRFLYPWDEDSIYVKRVIGVGGERIKIEAGTVYINGFPLKENYVKEKWDYDMEEMTIPENSYFLMGDNRNNSEDSRYYGAVDQEKLLGEAKVRFTLFHKKFLELL